jgi:hypothetical protein
MMLDNFTIDPQGRVTLPEPDRVTVDGGKLVLIFGDTGLKLNYPHSAGFPIGLQKFLEQIVNRLGEVEAENALLESELAATKATLEFEVNMRDGE